MSNSKLFEDLHNLLGDKPGMVIPHQSMTGIYLASAYENIQVMTDPANPVSIPATIMNHLDIDATLSSISIDPSDLTVTLDWDNTTQELAALISPDINFIINLHPKGDTTKVVSVVNVSAGNMYSLINIEAPFIEFTEPEFDIYTAVSDGPDREAGLAAAGVTEDELEMIEGAFIHTVASNIVSSAFSVSVSKINLESYYPSLKMGGLWRFEIVNDSNLVIIPSDVQVASESARVCPDSGIPQDIYEIKVPKPTSEGSGSYTVGISNPAINHRVSFASVRNVQENTLFLALYAPKPIFDKSFGDIKPSVAFRKRSKRTVGWKLAANAMLERLKLTLKPQRFGMELLADISVDGNGEVNVKVPCVGRKRIASLRFESKSPWSLVFFAGLGFGNGDEVVLKTKLESIKASDIDVTVSAFSRWLSYTGGKGLIMGIILDTIIGYYIGKELKKLLRKEIYKSVQAGTFKIIDFDLLKDVALPHYGVQKDVVMDGNDKALLIGVANNFG